MDYERQLRDARVNWRACITSLISKSVKGKLDENDVQYAYTTVESLEKAFEAYAASLERRIQARTDALKLVMDEMAERKPL